ncbi:MAG: biopolymer transporter ExbD [Cyanobacteria bacterium P01_A01_bin.105]
MKLDLDNPNEEVRIEIIPLVDVIFCILTFFILAAVSLTRQQAINLDLPGANTSAPLPTQADQRERIYVSVDATGTTYIDQSPVPLNVVEDVLRQHRQIYPNGLIVLYAARDARYENVVEVLDLLRKVGGDRVALATLPKADDLETDGQLPGLDPLDPTNPLNPSLDPLQPLPRSTDPLNPGAAQPGASGLPTLPGTSTTPGLPSLTNPGLTNPSLTNPSLTNPGLPGTVTPGTTTPGITPGNTTPTTPDAAGDND